MANGRRDYWNRDRRDERVTTSDTLATIQQVLGIGFGVADRIKQGKVEKEQSALNYVAMLTEGYQGIYDEGRLKGIKAKLDNYKRENLDKMSVDSIDMINIQNDKLEYQIGEVQHFNQMTGKIDALPDKAYRVVEQLADYYALPEGPKRRLYAQENWRTGGVDEDAEVSAEDIVQTRLDKENELRGYMEEYTGYMIDVFGRHGARLNAQNPYLVNRYRGLESVLVEAVDFLRDGKMSQEESELIKSLILNPDKEKLKQINQRESQDLEAIAQFSNKSFFNSEGQYRKLEQYLESGFYPISEDRVSQAVPGAEATEQEMIYVGPNFDEWFDRNQAPLYFKAGMSEDNVRAMKEQARAQSKGQRNRMKTEMAQHLDNLEALNQASIDAPGGIDKLKAIGLDIEKEREFLHGPKKDREQGETIYDVFEEVFVEEGKEWIETKEKERDKMAEFLGIPKDEMSKIPLGQENKYFIRAILGKTKDSALEKLVGKGFIQSIIPKNMKPVEILKRLVPVQEMLSKLDITPKDARAELRKAFQSQLPGQEEEKKQDPIDWDAVWKSIGL